ncbi:kinase-like domain, phloem protein 2-like protein [Tanacetum coccineum]
MSSLEYISHSQFRFEDIQSATNNFAPENMIRGRGRDNTVTWVWQGRMLHSGQFINIVARGVYSYRKDESRKFRLEKSMLSSLNHTNLVTVIGFADMNMITVYKKEANGSLNKYLSDKTLIWMQRLKICLGVANALSYIHYDVGRDFSVIHCNIRSSKILLDDKWEPKLSGFEFSLKNTVPRRHRLFLTRDVIDNVLSLPIASSKVISLRSEYCSIDATICRYLSGTAFNSLRTSVSSSIVCPRLAALFTKLLPFLKSTLANSPSPDVRTLKLLVLSAKAALYKFSNVDSFTLKSPAQSRFQEVIELLPQQVFHINCTIKSQMLSLDTGYVCYLVFKVSEKCHGLHCPVKVRDVLHQENNEAEFVYFITPSLLNINGITRVPKKREDGWMEIQVWKFNSTRDVKDDSVSMNMKFTSLEGTMSGLMVCGLEFRPVLEVKVDRLPSHIPDSSMTESDNLRKSEGLQKKFTEEAGIFSGCYLIGDGNPAGIDHLDELSSIVMIEPYRLYLVVDEKEQFREDDFLKMQDTFTKQKQMGEN